MISRLKQRGTKVIVTVFGSPYSLTQFTDTDGLVCAYQDMPEMEQVVPQVLFGGLGSHGLLPVSTGDLKVGLGEFISPKVDYRRGHQRA